MVTSKDGTDDSNSDYNSFDAEHNAQEGGGEDDGNPTPKTKVPSSHYKWSLCFRGYIEKFHRDLGHDKQKSTGKQW
jgi:hypothetical protein